MRRSCLAIILMVLPVALIGCHSKDHSPAAEPLPSSGLSLEQMRAEYQKLNDQYKADCLTGTPEHIQSTRAICEQERQKMAPLGNALMEAEARAAQHAKNP